MATIIDLAATLRKAGNYPANTKLEYQTDGMAELTAHLTGRLYSKVRAEIVARCEADTRTELEASQSLDFAGWE